MELSEYEQQVLRALDAQFSTRRPPRTLLGPLLRRFVAVVGVACGLGLVVVTLASAAVALLALPAFA